MKKAIATSLLLIASLTSLFAGGTYFGVTGGYDFTRQHVQSDLYGDNYTITGNSYSVALSGATFFGDILGFGYGMDIKFVRSMSQDGTVLTSDYAVAPQYTLTTVLPYFELRMQGEITSFLTVEGGVGLSLGCGQSTATIYSVQKTISKAQLNLIGDLNLSLDLFFELVLKAGARLSTPVYSGFWYDKTFHQVRMYGYTITPYVVLGYNY